MPRRTEPPRRHSKKGFAAALAQIAADHPEAERIEVWLQDEAFVGQKGRVVRRWLVLSRVWRSAAPSCSFLYVDYSISWQTLDEALTRRIERGGQGLLGYRPTSRRAVSRAELERPGHYPTVHLSQTEQAHAAEMYRMAARIVGSADRRRRHWS